MQNSWLYFPQANLQAMQVTQSKAGGSQLIKPKKKYSDDDCYQILPHGQVAKIFYTMILLMQ